MGGEPQLRPGCQGQHLGLLREAHRPPEDLPLDQEGQVPHEPGRWRGHLRHAQDPRLRAGQAEEAEYGVGGHNPRTSALPRALCSPPTSQAAATYPSGGTFSLASRRRTPTFPDRLGSETYSADSPAGWPPKSSRNLYGNEWDSGSRAARPPRAATSWPAWPGASISSGLPA